MVFRAQEKRTHKGSMMMLLRGGGGGGGAAAAWTMVVRHFSKKRSQDIRRINPKVPREEAKDISENLYQLIKAKGPLSVSNTWIQAQEVGVNGLNSKTHMKILLKWMWGKKMLKLFCTQFGSTKKFLYTTLPEDPQTVQEDSLTTPTPAASKKSAPGKKRAKVHAKKKKK